MIFETFIQRDDDGCYIPTLPNGYNELILPSKVDEIIKGLISYKKNYTDQEVQEINLKKIANVRDAWTSVQNDKTEKKKRIDGYVYLLECADKHKIGYSADVERRMKQLDTRPFPLELITKVYSEVAFDIEQEIHKELLDWRVEGEWYQFDFDFSSKEFEEYVHHIEEKILVRG